ncbi:efflux RND transporter permease subunit [Roseiarcaceae bacterium H3SJ34-1]|uniref:efflux RND transporter permease subunit n=1 Tax=Terripilifer ovatus TaxID=3032367 RepID=UPI003AB9732E|nr:efflux RND transporter permease subunit [Roseiarcaceae bacterium H3SJ34-1]
MTNPSAVFILRPIGTALLAAALMFAGLVAYPFLPVASMPSVEFPTIVISAGRPGADPETMAASVAAPLERALGSISGVTEMTSSSFLGQTLIIMQFDLSRKVESAARDVQAALNVAVPDLPSDLPAFPRLRKFNPASRPVMILAMTSDNLAPSALYDIADTLIAQRIAQVRGVGEVTVSGAEQPAIRVRVDPARIAAMGLGLEDVRTAVVNSSFISPVGAFDHGGSAETLGIDGQLNTPADYQNVVVSVKNSKIIRLGDIASVIPGTRNSRTAGWYNGKPAVILNVTKEASANIIETIDGVKNILPELRKWMPAGVDFSIMSDRSTTIRASILDLQKTLAISIGLVTMVVFLFLRRVSSTAAAAIAVPLSLSGTFGVMWLAGYSIDNLSLMAITVAVGFVVDDAIVMIENIHRNMENGVGRLEAALAGTRQIGFTVVSISVSLIAAFIPLLFMGGIPGRLFREFSMTLSFAIVISMIVSLTVTPMICGHFMPKDTGKRNRLDEMMDGLFNRLTEAYIASLRVALRFPRLGLVLFLLTIALTVQLYRTTPKGWLAQDDTGLLGGWTEASQDSSYEATLILQQKVADTIMADPAVESLASFIGNGSAVNSGRLNVALKTSGPDKAASRDVIARLRPKLARIIGIDSYLIAMQDVNVGGRAGRSPYQFTLTSSDFQTLIGQADIVLARLRRVPQLVDVASDRQQGGLQASVVIDRNAASRLGIKITDIDNALSNAFSQRQISTIYTERNQYKVILEISPSRQREPDDLTDIYVPSAGGVQVPLSTVARVERGAAVLSVNHQGPFPAITFTYDLAPGVSIDEGSQALRAAIGELHLPDVITADFAGDAKAFRDSNQNQIWLIVAALVSVYIILGILYESLIHPLTIISTLPSAGLGALIALNLTGTELSLVAFIAIIMLIGIVKKNGIMMVDFAIAAERARRLAPREAVIEACRERFRPILMTTLAAMLGALPLALGHGPGAELRRPLGIAIVGGLILSQILTFYSTPLIYLLMSRFSRAKHVSVLQEAALADLSGTH